MKSIKYSFVIPVFNSIDSLPVLYIGISDLMNELNQTFEVVFIDDCGLNESWLKLLELKKQFPNNIKLIKLTKNFGQNGATLCGIDEAVGEFIITMDDDLQVHPREIKKLIDYYNIHESDVIYGVYKKNKDALIRNVGSKIVKKIFTRSEGGSNVGSSIRLIKSSIADYLRHHSQDHLFINQVISWYTFDSQFVEISRDERTEGKSGYSLYKLFSIAFRLIFLYTTIPLKIMIVLCIIGSFGSLALASYYIYQHFAFGHGLGFLSLVVMAISLVLASISIMGIYLNRIYSSRVKKPHYAIKIKM